MKITFHGAVRTVTGSQHLLNVNGKRILLDCGLFQGRRRESYQRNQNLPYDAAEVDLLVLSHAHIDHSGNIPNLVKNGFQGDILCTYATRDLCAIMLRDSAKIQEYDVEYLNRKRKGNQPRLEPLYSTEDAVRALDYFVGMAYNRTRQIMPGVYLTLVDAGHILGSAMVILDIEDEERKRDVRLVFSGDIGRDERPILRDPSFIDSADVLLMESTYGDREHPPDYDVDAALAEVINGAYRQQGKVIVPAFAVGRTQEIVYRLHRLRELSRIPRDLMVYVDSPLAIDATGIYRLHPETYDEEMMRMLFDNHQDPFGFNMMRYTRATSESKELNHLQGAAVIISASGMAEAGRILHHLKNNVEDPRNTVLITGWQAPHTLGRRIVEKREKIRIFGEEYQLRARVETLNGLSGHADRDELVAWARHFQPRPRHTFLVHGEADAAEALAENLRGEGFNNVRVPHLSNTFTV